MTRNLRFGTCFGFYWMQVDKKVLSGLSARASATLHSACIFVDRLRSTKPYFSKNSLFLKVHKIERALPSVLGALHIQPAASTTAQLEACPYCTCIAPLFKAARQREPFDGFLLAGIEDLDRNLKVRGRAKVKGNAPNWHDAIGCYACHHNYFQHGVGEIAMEQAAVTSWQPECLTVKHKELRRKMKC